MGWLNKTKGKKRGFSLAELMVSVVIIGISVLTALMSVLYYQKANARNQRHVELTNLVEAMLERIQNQTWYTLSDPVAGVLPLGTGEVWPTETGALARRQSNALSLSLLSEAAGTADFRDTYTGLNGTVNVFYTPMTIVHQVPANVGSLVANFPVRYYKVEIEVTVDDANRIRVGTDADVWRVVTYVSELGGRTEEEFNERVLKQLSERVFFE